MGKVGVSVITVSFCEGAEMTRIPASRAMAAKWRVIPIRICVNGGEGIGIDRVTDIRRQASTKAGGLGYRYTCLVTAGDSQREIYLYKDEDEWFLETEVA